MLRKKSEKSIVRVADKITSLKEELDAMSWSRVSAIAEQLKKGCDEQTTEALAHEMKSIAQANISVYSKFGIEAEVKTGEYLPSGIEVLTQSLFEETGTSQHQTSGCDEFKETVEETEQVATHETTEGESDNECILLAAEETLADTKDSLLVVSDFKVEQEDSGRKLEKCDDSAPTAISGSGEVGKDNRQWSDAFQKWISCSEKRTLTSIGRLGL